MTAGCGRFPLLSLSPPLPPLLLLLLLPCRYVVVVQERGLRSAVELPELPGVEYVYYGGACYEWGIVGWLLQVNSSCIRCMIMENKATAE
jgi:hypothetical protein